MKQIVTAALITLLCGMALAADTSNRRESFTDRYSGLADHNIFLKDRTIKRVAATQPSAHTRQPEESLVFRGAVLDPEGYGMRAYIEDLNNAGNMLVLVPGDPIARGRLSEIHIDAIAYERGGEIVWIPMGADLTGKQVVPILSDSDTPTTGPVQVIDPNRTDLSMEEKLKLRRQQERAK